MYNLQDIITQSHKPIIAVSAGLNEEPAHRVVVQYVNAIVAAGGVPFILPVVDDEALLCQLLKQVDGLLMIGGGDIDSSFWGEEPSVYAGKPNLTRDRYDLAIAQIAKQLHLPVLGICRGMQALNIAFGGTILQDIKYEFPREGALNHSQTEERHITTHSIDIEPDSLLYKLIGNTQAQVNSFHHQAVGKVADCFKVTAYSKDGIIEAFESKYDYILGVQWHPEELYKEHKEQKALFQWLVNEALLYKGAKEIMQKSIVIDTHTDTPMEWKDDTDLSVLNDNLQVDFVKLALSGVRAVYMVAYLPQYPLQSVDYEQKAQEAYQTALATFGRIKEQCERTNAAIKLVKKVESSPQKQLLLGLENGFALAANLDNINRLAEMGVQYITLCHNGDNEICDSAKGSNTHGGLSAFGKEVVKRMNECGVLIDVSHAADTTVEQVLDIAQVGTVVATHSACRAICNHVRALPDDLIVKIAQKGGQVRVCAYRYFLDNEGNADIHTIVKHIRHLLNLIPASAIGIGSDFDGGGGVPGCNDITELINIPRELLRCGVDYNIVEQIMNL